MKNLLVITSRVPIPLDKGDKLRIYHQLHFLKNHFNVILVSITNRRISEDEQKQLNDICHQFSPLYINKLTSLLQLVFSIFSKNPFQVSYFYSTLAKRKLNRIIEKNKIDHIYCQLIRCSEYVKEYFHIPKTLDYMDALSEGMHRRIDKAPWYLKPFIKMEAKRLKSYESKIFDYFNHSVIISDQDRSLLNFKDAKKISIIPNGLDFNFFSPIKSEKKFDLLFTGNMSYEPNVRAVEYIVNEILPTLPASTTLMIAGINPSYRVKRLASERVKVTGYLKDIREAYNVCRIFVAPMHIGTGVQNKLLEAMSMKLPCICSPLANKGLEAKNEDSIIVASELKEYTNHINNLLKNDSLRVSMGHSAREFIISNYSWDINTSELVNLLNS